MPAGFTVLHASDFQCGRPYLSRATDALLELWSEVDPNVVIASGDLTQRAKRRRVPGGSFDPRALRSIPRS